MFLGGFEGIFHNILWLYRLGCDFAPPGTAFCADRLMQFCRITPDRPAGAGRGQRWCLGRVLQGGAKASLTRLQARDGGADFAEFIGGA